MDSMTPSGADPTPQIDTLADDAAGGPGEPVRRGADGAGTASAAAAMMPTDATSRLIIGAGAGDRDHRPHRRAASAPGAWTTSAWS